MTVFLSFLLVLNVIFTCLLFLRFYKKRKLFDDRYAMIMAATASGGVSLVLSMLIYFLFPIDLASISFVTATVGGLIGVGFGSLVKFQSLLSGFFHGVIGGLMGTMLGAVVKDPSLCSLPSAYFQQVTDNVIAFSLFGTFIVISTIGLLAFSLRV